MLLVFCRGLRRFLGGGRVVSWVYGDGHGSVRIPSRPFRDMVPEVMNRRLSFCSRDFISEHTSSTFLRRVTSFCIKVKCPFELCFLPSDIMRLAACSFLCLLSGGRFRMKIQGICGQTCQRCRFEVQRHEDRTSGGYSLRYHWCLPLTPWSA